MLRSAALAVLAIALSSSSAAAQSAEPDLEIDIMSMLDYELGDGNRVKLVGAKLAASTAAIFISEKLWKRNRAAAIGVMLVSNTVLSLVVAHNCRFKAAP